MSVLSREGIKAAPDAILYKSRRARDADPPASQYRHERYAIHIYKDSSPIEKPGALLAPLCERAHARAH